MRITRPPAPPPAPPPHSRFGPYTLADRIAVGGMAEVFRAHEPRQVGEPRVVVVKRMLPSLASESGARAMFEEEARLGALIEHDNVVRVLGFGDERGQPYLALEYVPGLDLWRFTRWLTRSGKTLPVELSIYLVRELLAGLHAVHEARDRDGHPLGLVHRDVSPSNVLLSIHGDVKIGDFGIAQALLRASYPQATLSDRAKGKLGYLAPEQVSGMAADPRADVFAAGVIAAELLMGRPLFAGGSELAVLLAIRDAQIRPFEEHARALPLGLGGAVRAALMRDPGERIPTAEALRDSLAPFENGDRRALRAELASWVTRAYTERQPSGTLPAVRDARTPASSSEAATPRFDTGDEHTPSVEQTPALEYYARTTDGTTLGPYPYAKMVEAVATGRVGLTDSIASGGSAFTPLHERSDLARHLPASSLSERTAQRSTPGEPDREWSLDGGTIVGVVAKLALERDSGLLLCEHSGVRKEVYLSEGAPEFVTSNLASELLGEFLVTKGVISRGELDMALAVMPRFEGRLGDTLTALGLVEPVHLFRQIASQVQEKLLELFTWKTGRATLWRGVRRPQGGFPLGLEPWKIVIDGIDRRLARGLDEWTAGRESAFVVANHPAPEGLAQASLPPMARAMLDHVQRPTRAAELITRFGDRSERDVRAGRRELVLLLAIGALRWT